MRTGLRAPTPEFTVFASKEITPNIRFGFVISKAVGSAVKRNRIKRQLRAISHTLLPQLSNRDIVIRVNPTAATSNFDSLSRSMTKALAGVMQ